MQGDNLNSNENAWSILGIESCADDQQIRTAYISKVRQFPPESCPEQFERIRDAYDRLKDPDFRARDFLFGDSPSSSFVDLYEQLESQRRFIGPSLWLEVLKDMSAEGGNSE